MRLTRWRQLLRRRRTLEACLIAGLIALAGGAGAPENKTEITGPRAAEAPTGGLHQYVLQPDDGSSTLQGYTSLGPWSARSQDIQATVKIPLGKAALAQLFAQLEQGNVPPLPAMPLELQPPAVVKLVVPVNSFHGSSGGMDRDMRHALRAAQHPDITYEVFSVASAKARPEHAGTPASLDVLLEGRLTVAGVQRAVTTQVAIRRDARGHYRISARQDMLMSDFHIIRPTALFGLIHADNAMSVQFDLDFEP